MSIRTISRSPRAITAGPTVMGTRGPMRWARAPLRAEKASITNVSGMVAAPAARGE